MYISSNFQKIPLLFIKVDGRFDSRFIPYSDLIANPNVDMNPLFKGRLFNKLISV
ncbi:hypothetical protein BTN49_1853 [Candidatus Enterovibrio escicola]|uniref:Uncharacterized protein n=1 Tax=Candidatus Enterovibrio escicola TaxID=1927127 RepID=A0A2A5T391_9GAMM|nr:hypothetical protein BTN49_1853 [Candidatus Enterovibrio escacola]